MKYFSYSFYILLLTLIPINTSNAQVIIDFETGPVFTGYNDVRIPGDEGTLFSLNDDLKAKTKLYYRLKASYTWNLRHTISLLYAPLETKSEGVTPNDIMFEGELFNANDQLDGTYKFNSYRLTYRYDIVYNPKFIFGFGFTAKIRDAGIRLSSSNQVAEKTNVGFVPIINFKLWWKLNDDFGLLLDGDALAAPQGRAEDVQIAGTFELSENLNIRAGYRILEGGANNDEVYNFALFNYVSFGISYTFSNKINHD